MAFFRRTALLELGRLVAAACVSAVHYTHQRPAPSDESTKPASKRWADVVGSRVAAEGIAFGASEKGFGAYIILNEATVYLDGVDLLKHQAEGRLIRATGVLARVSAKAADPLSQGPSTDVEYFTIKDPKWRIVDRVDWPWLEELRGKG